MLTARSYWCVGRVVDRSLYEELARSYALCFRELGMAENHAPTLRHYLLQDFAYSYRVWITLIKLLYASVWSPRIHPDIHQGERLYGSLLPSVPLVSEKNSSRDCLKNSDDAIWSVLLSTCSPKIGLLCPVSPVRKGSVQAPERFFKQSQKAHSRKPVYEAVKPYAIGPGLRPRAWLGWLVRDIVGSPWCMSFEEKMEEWT